jgi:hypothetical protein
VRGGAKTMVAGPERQCIVMANMRVETRRSDVFDRPDALLLEAVDQL